MTDAKPNKNKSAIVASHVPGRIRFKLHSQNRDKETMEGIRRNLEVREGIFDVRLNPTCGSVTVHYESRSPFDVWHPGFPGRSGCDC